MTIQNYRILKICLADSAKQLNFIFRTPLKVCQSLFGVIKFVSYSSPLSAKSIWHNFPVLYDYLSDLEFGSKHLWTGLFCYKIEPLPRTFTPSAYWRPRIVSATGEDDVVALSSSSQVWSTTVVVTTPTKVSLGDVVVVTNLFGGLGL